MGCPQQRGTVSAEARCYGGLNSAVEKLAALGKRCAFPTFPPHHGYWICFPFRVCKKNNGMKQQSNGVPENLMAKMVERTVGFIRTGTRASSLCARSSRSN